MGKYCIDCGKKKDPRRERCKSCSKKGKNNPNHKHGKYCQDYKHYCIDCGKEISLLIIAKRCWDCSLKIMSMKAMGEKNSQWNNGSSFEPYPLEWTETLKESIRQRDNYQCQNCGKKQSELKGRFKKLDIHHIDYDKNNLNPENLVSLCHKCHMKTNYNRDYWFTYFSYTMDNLVEIKCV